MCGIAGYILKSNQMKLQEMTGIVAAMTEAVKWRGPDGRGGVYAEHHCGAVIGLGHCRLAIRDLSERGRQPVVSPDGNLVLTYNGEIYNYQEIRTSLQKSGHAFLSDCDAEAVLHACMEWGVHRAVLKFNGMWAFALYDRKMGRITLARDRIGVKPLYYCRRKDRLAFGSDMRSLYCIPGFRKEISRKALHGYLWNMYIPSPYSIMKGISKLEPGTLLEYDIKNGQADRTVYWDMNAFHPGLGKIKPYQEYVSDLKKLLMDSVRIRLEADVPVGIFLSGGIDSTLVASLAQEQSRDRINTYAIGFREKKNDDSLAAQEAARVLGTRHEQMYCSPKDALRLIEKIPEAYSEPFADNSQIASMLLCGMTKKHVTVSLSGDGGDELFMGYPSYLVQQRLYKMRHFSRLAAKTVGRAADVLLPACDYRKWKVDKFCNASDRKGVLQLDYITAQPVLQLILPYSTGKSVRLLAEAYSVEGRHGEGLLSQSIRQGIRVSLPDDMLVKVDRASMYYSLECRCPLLDYRVVENSLAVPNDYKYHNGQLKAPLRDILGRYVPKHIIDRPKSGFGIPVSLWMHKDLNMLANDMLSEDFILRQGIFSAAGIREFASAFNRNNNPILDRIAYNLLVFQLWWKEYMDSD